MLRKEFIKLLTLTAAGQWLILQNAFAKNWLDPFQSNTDVRYVKAGEQQYDLLRQGFNKRIQKFPSVIAVCANVTGVQQAVKLAKRLNIPVSIQSGGHCMEGFSVSQGGMMISLKQMNQIEWIDKDTIRVGPACTLSALYNELLPRQKYLPGGSCAGVAIGGLTMGGGYGLMSRKFGLTCDSLLSVNMVDGMGNLLDSKSDPELLWACKGGNNGNFGVVTSLTFRVHAAPKFLRQYKFRSFQVNTERANKLMQTWFKYSEKLPNECFSAFVLNRKTVYILLTQTGPDHPATKRFIQEIKKQSDKQTQTSAQPLAQALRNYYGRTEPLYFKNASAGLYQGYADVSNVIDRVMENVSDSAGLIFQINTMGGKIKDVDAEKSAAFPHRRFDYFSELQAYWDQPTQAKSRLQSFQKIQQLINDGKQRPQYRNYPDIEFAQPLVQYYGDSLPRLKKIKQRLDPENLFRFEQGLA